MEKIILQITSGKGPVECELAVALALKEILKESAVNKFKVQEVNRVNGQMERTLNSVTLEMAGENLQEWIITCTGIWQWICVSPYRKYHKRKNWFIGVNAIPVANSSYFNQNDVEFKTMKAGGPGGQHVNKTESAIRATHIPSRIAVTASESRSQHENKKLALQKLKDKVEQWFMEKQFEQANTAWLNHHQLERGNPKRIYEGIKFRRVQSLQSKVSK